MRASVSLWSTKDPREAATDVELVLLGRHRETGRVELGTVGKRGVTFGRSRYWPGKSWDGQWEWTYLPIPKTIPPEYEQVLMHVSFGPDRVTP